MNAETEAVRLADALSSEGAGSGVVACRALGSGPAFRSWGEVSASSVFEAGSVTKLVTGLLLALAINAGEVSSSDRLGRFVPGTGRAGRATLAELATHTSGLPRLPAVTLLRMTVHPRDPYRGISLRRLLRDTCTVHPRRAGQFAYSNLGVALLGHALAAAATMPYWDLAQTRVLVPLGMAGSGNMPKRVLADPRQAWDVGAFAPAGGLWATVGDLLRLAWTAVRPEESPFPAAAADALTQRVARGNGYVGWCWMIERDFQTGQQSAWHNGATGSGMAFVGANSSFAAALCVPGRRWQAWNAIALRALAEPTD